MSVDAPLLVVREVQTGVRPVHLRLPFRFGATTLTDCPQLFVRATVEVAGCGTAQGYAAEMMVPRWFDKRAEHSAATNVAHLADSLSMAIEAYASQEPCSAFQLFARQYASLAEAGRGRGQTALSAGFGQAVLDRAVIDAVCRALNVTFLDAMHRNALGIEGSDLAMDLRGFDWSRWLRARKPRTNMQARHTVGLLDEIDEVRFATDGLPASLPAAIERYGHTVFKIKLGGDPEADVERLSRIMTVLARIVPEFSFTLDGNEQYTTLGEVQEFADAALRLPELCRRPEALLYLEQAVPRDVTLSHPLPKLGVASLIDEADSAIESFAAARRMGWTGVSSKGCKGFYKSMTNRARCDVWNEQAKQPRYFMSAEDLCCQAGLSVQQDLAIASLLGMTHAERNGHHYVNGMAAASLAEQQGFQGAHSDLYETLDGSTRIRIAQGAISLDSVVASVGFASSTFPDMRSTESLCDAHLMA